MNSALFGTTLTLSTFLLGRVIHRKTNFFLFSPLLVSVTLCIVTLLLMKIPYENYLTGGNWIGFFLTPSTICLAVPLYEQFEKLKKNWYAILGGITSGVLSNLAFIFIMCLTFKIGHNEYVSLLPKSITTAIALGTAKAIEMGDIEGAMSGLSIAVTGLLTVVFSPFFVNLI